MADPDTAAMVNRIMPNNMKKRKFGLLNAGLFNKIVFPGRVYIDSNGKPVNPELDGNGYGDTYAGDAFNTANISFSGELAELYADPDTFHVQGDKLLMKKRVRDDDGRIMNTYSFQVGDLDLSGIAEIDAFVQKFVTIQGFSDEVARQTQQTVMEATKAFFDAVDNLSTEQKEALTAVRDNITVASESTREENLRVLAQSLEELKTEIDEQYATKSDTREMVRNLIIQTEEAIRIRDAVRAGETQLAGVLTTLRDDYWKKSTLEAYLTGQYIDTVLSVRFYDKTYIEDNFRRLAEGSQATRTEVERAVNNLSGVMDNTYVKRGALDGIIDTRLDSVGKSTFAPLTEIQNLRTSLNVGLSDANQSLKSAMRAVRNTINLDARELETLKSRFRELPSLDQLRQAVNASSAVSGDLASLRDTVDDFVSQSGSVQIQLNPIDDRVKQVEFIAKNIITNCLQYSDTSWDSIGTDEISDVFKALATIDKVEEVKTSLNSAIDSVDTSVSLLQSSTTQNNGEIVKVKGRLDTIESDSSTYVRSGNSDDIAAIAAKVSNAGYTEDQIDDKFTRNINTIKDYIYVRTTKGARTYANNIKLTYKSGNNRQYRPLLVHNFGLSFGSAGNLTIKDPVTGPRCGAQVIRGGTTADFSGVNTEQEFINGVSSSVKAILDTQFKSKEGYDTILNNYNDGKYSIDDVYRHGLAVRAYKDDVYLFVPPLSAGVPVDALVSVRENKRQSSVQTNGSKVARTKNRSYHVVPLTLTNSLTGYRVFRIDAFDSSGTARPSELDIDITVHDNVEIADPSDYNVFETVQ